MTEQKQSWKTCKYSYPPNESHIDYLCGHPKIIKLKEYTKVCMPEEIRDDLDCEEYYARLYPDDRFHKTPSALFKILTMLEQELNINSKKIIMAQIKKEKILQRALAGCRHCKFYEFDEYNEKFL